MLDRTGEWCFEGGCTYMNMTEQGTREAETDIEELEALYREPCLGMYD